MKAAATHTRRKVHRMRVLALVAMPLLATGKAWAGETFRDCADCPEMVVVEPGHFRMGSPVDEPGRAKDGREGPAHEAQVRQRFALGRTEVSVGEFARFVSNTGHVTSAERDPAGASCLGWLVEDKKLAPRPGLQWREPGYPQGARHPVVCVSWNDAQAYIAWLSQRAGKPYRLASETEWEFAARAGSTARWPWGNDPAQACMHANVADNTPGPEDWHWAERHDCTDGQLFAAPVASYQPNAKGLNDLVGNVWEWVQDCYDTAAYTLADTPRDGSAHELTDCKARGLRGGAWISGPERSRPAYRGGYGPETRANVFGFRVARSL